MALPKTLGRALAVAGAGSGLTSRSLAKAIGEETHVLTVTEMPSHSHAQQSNTMLNGGSPNISPFDGESACANGGTTANTGGDAAHNNMQPTAFFNAMAKL